MNNQLLKVLAALLALGALGVAYLGIRLSQQPTAPAPAPTAAASQPTFQVLVAAKALPAGQAISSQDLINMARNSLPDQAITSVQSALGRIPTRDIAQGEAMQESMFLAPRLSNLLKPGERAVGVRIDEVVGLGGFAEPGDLVDVLVFITGTRETNDTTTSSVAVRAARVLAFGDDTLLSQAPEASHSATEQAKDATGVKEVEKARDRRLNLKSAVLAVPEQEASRLMLASSQGQIKLALRPANETATAPDAEAPGIRNVQSEGRGSPPRKGVVTLGELAQAPKPPAPAASMAARRSAPAPTMEIFEGSTLRKVPL
ncbi:MAG: Flp pilus assembly protein CpaB [Pseudomonadota bacterium]|jgi:pilus assembly protein CpaB